MPDRRNSRVVFFRLNKIVAILADRHGAKLVDDDFVDFLRSGSSFETSFERISDSKAYTIPDCYASGVSIGGSAGNNVQNEEISFSGREATEDL